MGVWQVRGRWVIGISGRCSAQSVGKPPLAGNFIGANVRWRILNLLNFCHRTILLDRNSSVWGDTHGTLVGGCAELICGWQATNRSMAGSYKSAFRSVSGHPPASVEGGYYKKLFSEPWRHFADNLPNTVHCQHCTCRFLVASQCTQQTIMDHLTDVTMLISIHIPIWV